MSDAIPECPACETDLLVAQYAGPDEWLCYGCSRTFDAGATFHGQRGRVGR